MDKILVRANEILLAVLGPWPLKTQELLKHSSEQSAACAVCGCTREWSWNFLDSFKIDVESAFLSPPAPASYSLVKTKLTLINLIPVPPCVLETLQPGWKHWQHCTAVAVLVLCFHPSFLV